MTYQALYQLLCTAYKMVLRDLVVKAMNDPNSDWDEVALKMLDGMFSYVA